MALRMIRASLFLVTALAVGAFTFEAVRLLAWPQVVDPVETAVLDRAERFAKDGPLYADASEPSLRAVMPGMPVATSLLVRMFDARLWEPRLLALLATLMCAALVLVIVRRETDSWTLAVAGAGFAVLGHGLLAEPLGIGRPDMPMMLLALTGFMVLRHTNGAWGALLAAPLLGAAFFVDERAAWFIVAAIVACALEDWRRSVTLTFALAVCVGGGYVGLSQTFGPWFNYQAWDAPLRELRFDPGGLLRYVGDHLLGRLAVPTLAAVLSFAMPTAPWRGKGGLWMCFGIAAVIAGLAATQSADWGPHALLPGILALAMLGPMSMQRVTGHLSAWPGSTRLAGRGVVLAALALQMIVFLTCVTPSRWTRSGPPAAAAAAESTATRLITGS
jgi:hypothetical protein